MINSFISHLSLSLRKFNRKIRKAGSITGTSAILNNKATTTTTSGGHLHHHQRPDPLPHSLLRRTTPRNGLHRHVPDQLRQGNEATRHAKRATEWQGPQVQRSVAGDFDPDAFDRFCAVGDAESWGLWIRRRSESKDVAESC